ncbi:efflux RND transporter periplasmic adaptor subunit [Lutibacter sp.]|uniref:efflux RND transporter periplasmic adaptor subunit n=1 Tax=Lutibacter sp. TaxID=1925666 RepID=UPI002735E29E|nr:efflux RND transporter periplasmic adaptor subunit [Lutibacter sp.]MDP3312020.1 efflux RND transporter periplasmic adaptor subunit [Lutibacter sp.]
MKLFSNQYIRYGLFIIIGLLLGWLFFHSSATSESELNHASEQNKAEIWTCSMHPQIRMDKPGKCPLCAMDLILLNQNSSEAMDPDEIHFTKEAAQLANVMTSVVSKNESVKEVRLFGKVQADERLVQSQVAYIPGRIEKLYVNFTGESVRKGQLLALIYAPDLITAQQELLETVKTKQSYPEFYEAAKEKLFQWKLSSKQIATIESTQKVKTNVEVYATSSGIITAKQINVGDYVGQGTVLFEVTDLSRIWVLFDAYESDLHFLKKGNKMDFTLQAMPGSAFNGIISFIDPVIDPSTRVAKVRLEINNQDGKLKPEMFATGFVKANLDHYQNKMVVPKTAVLWTGKRSIVYVKKPGNDPIFKIREIELGPMLGNSYVVEKGLTEGEEIVTQGAFSVDAAAQLEGKPSMMNTEGGKVSTGHENHTGRQETKVENSTEITKKVKVSSNFQQQLKLVFNNYIKIKNALANDDGKTSQKYAVELLKSLKNVDMKLLKDKESHTHWMTIEKDLKTSAELISKNSEIKVQREKFIVLSKNISKSIKLFGINQKVYEQFCPMANSDKGAIWLSTEEKIINPYFGASMLQCGTIQSIIE